MCPAAFIGTGVTQEVVELAFQEQQVTEEARMQ
jgi:hypothetical protein